jgi:predicted aconitase with swiveling domain
MASGGASASLSTGVKCWGANWAGQLGDGTTEGRSSPIDVPGLSGIAAITAGMRHTCALTTAGTVKCWGENDDGQLGDGATSDRHIPTDVTQLDQRIAAIAASRGIAQGSTCALTVDGGLKCWGDNSAGQLGDGTTTDRTVPTDVSGLAANVSSFTLGRWHACALIAGGRVKCWGSDVDGQLGVGSPVHQPTPANVRAAAAPTLLLDYTTGQTGSFFTITGWNFPPGGVTPITVNGITLTMALPVNQGGSFIFFLDTRGAGLGSYTLTAQATESASVTLLLAENAPRHAQGGGGQTFALAGIAPVKARLIFLPVIRQGESPHEP